MIKYRNFTFVLYFRFPVTRSARTMPATTAVAATNKANANKKTIVPSSPRKTRSTRKQTRGILLKIKLN